MRMSRVVGWVAALAVAASFAVPALGQMPEIPPGKWWKRPRVVEMLKIAPEQQQRLEEIFSKNRRAFIDLRADVERRQLDMEELLARKDADPKKVSAAVDALEQARGRLAKARTMMIVEMKGVLTEDQWQRIVDAREEWRRQRMEDRRRGMRENAPQRKSDAPPPPGGGDGGEE